jgi:hypothetical protein
VSPQQDRTTDELVDAVDEAHRETSRIQREMLGTIAEMDRREIWRGSGARDLPHWLAMRQGISQWKARRWIAAAHALEHLTDLAHAFATGELGIDKVVELARFASFETEAGLIRWATFVSCAAVRRRADLEVRRAIDDAREAERGRFLRWWHVDDGNRLGLEAELPAAQGAIVASALQRVTDTLPVMPGEEDPSYAEARRADALVAVCSSRLADDADSDRATVIVHARLGDLATGGGSVEIGDGGLIHPEIARRLLCDGRVQAVLEDEEGEPLRLGRLAREPSPSMMRVLRHRDGECRFPGCGARRFTQAHHIIWWGDGGPTDLDNLILLCFFHHKLVHEHGWEVRRDGDGGLRWAEPDGSPYRLGPGTQKPSAREHALPLLAESTSRGP